MAGERRREKDTGVGSEEVREGWEAFARDELINAGYRSGDTYVCTYIDYEIPMNI